MTASPDTNRLHTLALLGAAMWLAASPAAAQSPSSSPQRAPVPRVTWTVAAGYSSTSLRDIARRNRPVDASPISLVGHGPTVSVRLDVSRPARLHRFEIDLSSAGRFSLVGPIRTVARADDERLSRFGGRYEYRRYPFRDVLFRGLDIGAGGLGSGDRRSLNRRMSPGIAVRETEVQAGLGIVAAARFHRWRRFGVEAAWTNGAVLAHTAQSHSASDSPFSSFGGGWLTHLRVIADLRIGSRTSLALSYFRDDGGLFSSHHAVVSTARQVTVGVTYGK